MSDAAALANQPDTGPDLVYRRALWIDLRDREPGQQRVRSDNRLRGDPALAGSAERRQAAPKTTATPGRRAMIRLLHDYPETSVLLLLTLIAILIEILA
jgi:hypothetical protein